MRTAVLGATGLVGRLMLAYLAQREWAEAEPLLLVSKRSTGSRLEFRGRSLRCQDAAAASLDGIDLALFSAGAAASRQYAPRLCSSGAWVVDNSSAFRMEPDVPLVVPEINPHLVPQLRSDRRGGGIIANPNCSTIQIAVPLALLQQVFGLSEVHVTTLQAVSGAGRRACQQLEREVAGGDPRTAGAPGPAEKAASGQVFSQPIAFNALPAIGAGLPDGSYEEEAKVGRELRKILDQPDLVVTCTAIRVAVFNGHAAAVRVVLKQPADLTAVREALMDRPGLVVASSPHDFVTPRQADGKTEVFVGRLRAEAGRDDAVLFWVVADNLRKGAAWNAIQIADLLARV